MRPTKRPFLIDGDPALTALLKWQAAGVCCVIDETGSGFDIINYTWPKPGTDARPAEVPAEAIEQLGEHYDEILSHLRYWKQTREIVERIHRQHEFSEA